MAASKKATSKQKTKTTPASAKTSPKKITQNISPAPKTRKRLSTNTRFILLSCLAVFFLLIANSAFWVNKQIFNTENFSKTATNSLLSESSRNAVASEIIDQTLSDRPVIKNTVQEPSTKFISGLLATSQARAGVERVTAKIHIVLTSKNQENIEFDLSGIKQTVSKLINLAGREEAGDNLDKIPSKIVLLDVSKIPDFYKLGTLFMWLAPITFIAGLLILAWPHIKARKVRMDLLLSQGLLVIAGYLLALLAGPLFRPPVLSQFSNTNLRMVAENFYNSFVASFNEQASTLLALGLIMILVTAGNSLYKFIKSKRA